MSDNFLGSLSDINPSFSVFIPYLNHNSDLYIFFSRVLLAGLTTACMQDWTSKRKSSRCPYTNAVRNASFQPSPNVLPGAVPVMRIPGVIARPYDVWHGVYSRKDSPVSVDLPFTRRTAAKLFKNMMEIPIVCKDPVSVFRQNLENLSFDFR